MQIVIDTPGTTLKRKSGKIEVIHAKGIQQFAPHKVSSIVIHSGISLTSDVVLMAVDNQIDIIFSSETGKPEARIWSHKFGSISTIRKQQLALAGSHFATQKVLQWAAQKVQNQFDLLQALQKDRPAKAPMIEQAAKRVADAIKRVTVHAPKQGSFAQIATHIRSAEAHAAKAYFAALAQIVPQQYYFQGRSRRPAKDKFNSVLNYLYGMLYGIMEGALIKAGIDPYIGFMHRDEHNRPSMVYDFIEPFRTWADEVALKLALGRLLDEDFFSINPTDGGHWLDTPGRRIVIMAMNDYLEQVIDREGKRRTRRNHLDEAATAFAQELKNQAKEAPTEDDENALEG